MGKILCCLGLHDWISSKILVARFCRRCGLIQRWRLPGRGSWTTIGQLTTKLGFFDEKMRDTLEAMYLTWKQTGLSSAPDFFIDFQTGK